MQYEDHPSIKRVSCGYQRSITRISARNEEENDSDRVGNTIQEVFEKF